MSKAKNQQAAKSAPAATVVNAPANTEPATAKQEATAATTEGVDPQAAPAATVDASIAYPRTVNVQNNTPIPIYLSEVGKRLAANYHAPDNAAVVTYQTADHFAREMANIDAIASVHGFQEPLVFSEPEGSDGAST